MEANYHNLYKIGEAILDFESPYCYDSKDYNSLYKWFKQWLAVKGIEYLNSHSDQYMMVDFINYAHEEMGKGTHDVWLKSKTIVMNAIFMKNTKLGSAKFEEGFTLKQLKNKKWNISDHDGNKITQVEDSQIAPLLKDGTVLQVHNPEKK